MSNCVVFLGHSVLSDKSAICKCGFCRFGLVLRTSVALQLHLHSLTAALTPSKLLASASQSHDLLKKPVATLPFTASLIFSSQSLECQDSKNAESKVDSKGCHFERSEKSISIESKHRDTSATPQYDRDPIKQNFSNADSNLCHTEPLGEVSKILKSKRDFSPFSKTRTSKALAHTCKYDKNLDSIHFAPLHPAPAQVTGNLKSKNTQSTQNLKMLHNLCSQRFTRADFKDYATLHKHFNNTAEVSWSDFKCFTKESIAFQSKGEGSCLKGNDRALSAESLKSVKETTQTYKFQH